MTRKSVLITGANKSIGFETACQFGRLGYRVWLGARDDARGSVAAARLRGAGHDVLPLSLDVTNDGSVQEAAAIMGKEGDKLDVLINNAGIPGASRTTPSQQAMDDIRSVYDTNVFGAIRVTQAFLPLLRSAGHASIVMVSSGLGSLGWLSDPANQFYGVNILGYNSSK